MRDSFSQGHPLILESAELITVNKLLQTQQQVLTLSIPQQGKQQDNLALQIILTTIFYLGVLLCAFIWLGPLIKRLQLLRNTAKRFGEFDFSARINISNSPYIIAVPYTHQTIPTNPPI